MRLEPLDHRHEERPDRGRPGRRAVAALVHDHSRRPRRWAPRSTAGCACRRPGRCCPSPSSTPRRAKAVGMTTYMNVDAANKRVEIGSTWYRRSVQRTALNTAVQAAAADPRLRAPGLHRRRVPHALLQPCRAGAASSGWAPSSTASCAATREPDGTLRDTCVYCITASEWPTVQSHLTFQLDKPRE